jgi:CHAT domain-containing protein
VPDGNLAILPFDVLRENSNSLSLGQQYSISLSPSVSCSIIAKQKQIDSTRQIIAFGGAWYDPIAENNTPAAWALLDYENRLAALNENLLAYATRGNDSEAQEKTRAADFFGTSWQYLGGTVAEIQGLARIFIEAPTIYQGREVTKRNIKRLSLEGILLDYQVIHFALHGFFDDNLTPQAALVLSEASGLLSRESREDGYLSIEDIALLQLNAKMVMLSACQTGLGQIIRGDGMSGLARSFMVAGAQNVGVSLWKIDDTATSQFMWRVYSKVIHEGLTFRDAYREVKEEFRNSVEWNHPFYWAGFTLYE